MLHIVNATPLLISKAYHLCLQLHTVGIIIADVLIATLDFRVSAYKLGTVLKHRNKNKQDHQHLLSSMLNWTTAFALSFQSDMFSTLRFH